LAISDRDFAWETVIFNARDEYVASRKKKAQKAQKIQGLLNKFFVLNIFVFFVPLRG
jgi:hypothetical protein